MPRKKTKKKKVKKYKKKKLKKKTKANQIDKKNIFHYLLIKNSRNIKNFHAKTVDSPCHFADPGT